MLKMVPSAMGLSEMRQRMRDVKGDILPKQPRINDMKGVSQIVCRRFSRSKDSKLVLLLPVYFIARITFPYRNVLKGCAVTPE